MALDGGRGQANCYLKFTKWQTTNLVKFKIFMHKHDKNFASETKNCALKSVAKVQVKIIKCEVR